MDRICQRPHSLVKPRLLCSLQSLVLSSLLISLGICRYGFQKMVVDVSTFVLKSHVSWFVCQTYLQSLTVRLEEWRLKKRDTEEWMRHRQLPEDLRDRVRRYEQYKWLAARGVDEEVLLQSLPTDLRRDIQRHLCLDLVRRVSFSIVLVRHACSGSSAFG